MTDHPGWTITLGTWPQYRQWMDDHQADEQYVIPLTGSSDMNRVLGIEGLNEVVELPGWERLFPGDPSPAEVLARLETRKRRPSSRPVDTV
jgi:hypothetical protein